VFPVERPLPEAPQSPARRVSERAVARCCAIRSECRGLRGFHMLPISTIAPQDVTHADVHLCVLECFCRINPHLCHGAAVRVPRRRLHRVDRGTILLGIHVILVVLPKAYPHQQQCANRQEATFESSGSIWRRRLLNLVHVKVDPQTPIKASRQLKRYHAAITITEIAIGD
jgi:hypothetical protein